MIDDTPGFTEAELRRQRIAGTRDWQAYPPTVDEVKAWRASIIRNIERGRMISWTGAGWIYNHHMADAEKRYKALGLM